MASSRQLLVATAAATLFACGIGFAWAAARGLYATGFALALLALWVGLAWTWNGRPRLTVRSKDSPSALESATAELRVLANLLDQAPAPMLTLHADGGVRAANRAARRLFAADDLLIEAPEALYEALTAGDAHAQRLTVDLGAAGWPQTYAMSVTDFVGPRGVRRLAVLLDIQPELQAAEAAALRELMGVLSHEIMNGLTPIASLAATAADLLCEKREVDMAKARASVATLARRSEGLARFVAGYRALAQLPPPVLRPTSLSAVMEEAQRLFHARWGDGVRLVLERPTPDVIALIDEEQVQRALTNLLTNAAEAALSANTDAPLAILGARAERHGVVLIIEDNGEGLGAADSDRIFQPFFTTKAAGTGIGLNLARQVARAHGGDLTVVPSNRGAKFGLRLA